MALKKNNPGACAGSDCCGPDRPCCAVLWDDVRAHVGLEVSLVNVSSALSASTTWFEFFYSGDFMIYQCAGGASLYEKAPPALDSYAVTSGIYRVRFPTTIDPVSGVMQYAQSYGEGAVRVHACDPSEFEVEGKHAFRLRFDEPPDFSDFTCVETDGYECTVWERTDGTAGESLLSRITKVSATDYDFLAHYFGYFPTVADIPFPLTVAHYYNPANTSTLIEWTA